MNFVQMVDFDWLPGQPKCKFLKKIFKNFLLRSHKGDEAETLHKCFVLLCSTQIMFFIAVAHVVSLLWQL